MDEDTDEREVSSVLAAADALEVDLWRLSDEARAAVMRVRDRLLGSATGVFVYPENQP
jgi:hypothetical protein